ncbi:MAG: hypothetical protein ABR501_14435 [Pyrinomonadaceae bacterium]
MRRIPDLVVHWDDAAFASPLRIKGSGIDLKLWGKVCGTTLAQ